MKKVWLALAGALFFTLMGFGMRYAEESQVGYTHDASMWVFVVAGLCAYYAVLAAFKKRS